MLSFQWPGLGDIGEGSTAGHSYCEDVTSPIHQGLQHSLVSIHVAFFYNQISTTLEYDTTCWCTSPCVDMDEHGSIQMCIYVNVCTYVYMNRCVYKDIHMCTGVNGCKCVHMCPGFACVYMERQVWPHVYRDVHMYISRVQITVFIVIYQNMNK